PVPARDAKGVRRSRPFLPDQLQDVLGGGAQRRQGFGRRLRQGDLRKGNRARSGRGGQEKVTRMSKSKTRRVAAIGNSRVILAKAGIQCLWRRCGRAANVTGFPLSRERRGWGRERRRWDAGMTADTPPT